MDKDDVVIYNSLLLELRRDHHYKQSHDCRCPVYIERKTILALNSEKRSTNVTALTFVANFSHFRADDHLRLRPSVSSVPSTASLPVVQATTLRMLKLEYDLKDILLWVTSTRPYPADIQTRIEKVLF